MHTIHADAQPTDPETRRDRTERFRRVHVVGCPRSGTTLAMELLCTCFRSTGYCEHEMSVFEIPERRPGVFFSKRPTDIFRIETVFRRDPELFVVHVQRDPRSVITSVHRMRPDRYFCNFRVWKQCAEAAGRLHGHPRCVAIRYEDLVRDPDAIQRQLEERFPFLEATHRFSEFEKFSRPSRRTARALNGLRRVSADRVSSWRDHLSRVRSQLDRHPEMCDLLLEHGYEKDAEWTRLLEGVPREEHRCRYDDSIPLLKRLEERLRIWRRSRRYIARRGLRRTGLGWSARTVEETGVSS